MHVEFPARLPPLADLDTCGSDLEDISDTDVFFRKAESGHVLTEPAGRQLLMKVGLLRSPAGIVIGSVMMNCLVDAAVSGQIRLAVLRESVPVEIQWSARRDLSDRTGFAPGPALFDRADEQARYRNILLSLSFPFQDDQAASVCSWQISSASAG